MRWLPLLLILPACRTGPPPEMEQGVVAILEQPDRFLLYSLHPYRSQPLLGIQERLGGYPVLGRVELDKGERKAVLAALWSGFEGSSGTDETGFLPRYAIRADRGAESVYFLLCFRCRYANWYVDGRQAGGRATTAGPEGVLEGILTSHRIPLARE